MNYLDLPFRLLEIILNDLKWWNNYTDIKKKLLIGKKYNEYIIKLTLNQQLVGYTFINKLINLEYLNLNCTFISDINNLPKNLIELHLWNCHKITDFRILSEMKSLEILQLNKTSISDINNLPKNLIKLHLWNCHKITDFRILSEMKSLEYLDLECTKISDINNLPKSLIKLWLYNCNQIEDYSGLYKLPHCKIMR